MDLDSLKSAEITLDSVVRCFCCQAPRKLEEMGQCPKCQALICGSAESNCPGACLCDEIQRLFE